MCMASFIPGGQPIPYAALENGATWNQDGYGYALAAGPGLMFTGKSLDFEIAVGELLALRDEYPDAPALFHSRMATHGSVNQDNCHPFPVGEHSVMAHNGIMPQRFQPGKKDGDISDTEKFAMILAEKMGGFWSRRERRRIGRAIGLHNKLVILSVNPAFVKPRGFVINSDAGVWTREGIWHSNHDFEYHYSHPTKYDYSTTWTKDGYYTNSRYTEPSCIMCYSTKLTDSGYCLICGTCQDCAEFVDECRCYVPEGMSKSLVAYGDVQSLTRSYGDMREEPDEELRTEIVRMLEANKDEDDDDTPNGGWVIG